MSDRTKTKAAKTTNTNIDRVGVAIDKTVRAKGMALAKQDHRSFSSFITNLIEHEWERSQTLPAKGNGKRVAA